MIPAGEFPKLGRVRWVVPALLAIGVAGCTPRDSLIFIFGPNNVMEGMNPQYSFNVISPPWWWPDEDTFAKDNPIGDAKRDYYAQYGRPDWLRVWYNKDGVMLSRNEINQREGLPMPKGVSWIYLDRDVEVSFISSSPVEKPIDDEIATLCEMGDPDEVKALDEFSTARAVRYVYRREGMFIDFQDFKKGKIQRVPPMPGWNR